MTHEPGRANAPWDPASEARHTPRLRRRDIRLTCATLLVALGAALLLMHTLEATASGALWPFWFVAAGGAVLVLAFTGARSIGEPLVVLGSVVLSVGGLLLFQSLSGYRAVWTYAWALVAPTSIGAGLWLWGRTNHRADVIATGAAMAQAGIVVFIVLGALIELVLKIGDVGRGRAAWAIALVAVGALAMGHTLWRRRSAR